MRKATGTITLTREGRFRVRVPSGGERVDVGTFDSRAEAERERAAALDVLAEKVATGLLVGEWLDAHLTRREDSKAFRDADNERAYFDRDVKPDAIAKMPLKAVRPHDADEFVDRLRGKGHSNATIAKIVGIVRGGLRAAVRKELILSNPFADVVVGAQKRTELPWTYANVAEQDALVRAARAHAEASYLAAVPIDAMLDFAMGSGLRAGELVTLRLADVDVDGPDPSVTVRYGTAPDLPTKTGRLRVVYLFGRALDGMRRWLAAMPAWASKNDDGLVFVGTRGGFRDESHVIQWRDWKDILKRAGITRRFRWHDLRHTCASSLVSGFWGRRWSLEEIMAVMGHTDIKTTQRYAHLAPSAVAEATREASRALIQSVGNRSGAKLAIVPKAAESLSAPEPIRTADQRFRKALVQSVEGGGKALRDRLATDSTALLLAAERGDAEEVRRLGVAVAGPLAQLALDVLAGGPDAPTKAVELADLMALTDLFLARGGDVVQ